MVTYELNKPKLKFSKALFIYLFLYLIWTFSVAISHGESLYDFYLYCRYFVLSFILMYISYNIYKIKHYANFILKSIDLFVLIQILASIFLFFTEGRLERNVGTMSSSGGALATVWPLTFAPYYFLRYVVKGRWLDVVFLVGLVFIGFASGKRGVYFLIPLSLIIIYYFFLTSKILLNNKKSKFRMFFSVIILFVALVFGIANTESLAQGQGFSLKGIQNSFNYLQEYTTQESKIDRTSTGRTSTTINTFNALLSNSGKFMETD